MMDDNHVRKRHVSLSTQQHRLRHLKGIYVRNINLDLFSHDIREDFILYYTINLIPSSKVIYTSEVIENNLNPNWGLFEMSHFPEDTSGSTSAVQVKVWCCSKKSEPDNRIPHLVVDWIINFTGLYYIGEQIPKDGKKFNSNTIICCMVEGHYSSENCLISSSKSKLMGGYVIVEANTFRPSYNLSSIQRIHTVQRAMKQTKAAVRKEWLQIKGRLADVRDKKEVRANMELVKIRLRLLGDEVKRQDFQNKQMQETLQNNLSSQHNQRIELTSKIRYLKKHKEEVIIKQRLMTNMMERLLKTNAQVSVRWKQLISELSFVYPVERFSVQIPDKLYKICGAMLPNSEDFAGHQEVMLSVALGYVAHLILMISRFLNVPLRYPIKHFGSRSTIIDHMTDQIPNKDREFPLFCKGKDKLHFTYGVYLLNKNIAQLRHYSGLTTQDLRATLPNLHSLLELRLSFKGEQIIIPRSSGLNVSKNLLNAPAMKNVIISDRSLSGSSDSSNRKYSNDSEVKLASVNPSPLSNLTESMDSNLAKEAANGLGRTSSSNNIVSNKAVNMNNNFSYSLDQGLNNISASSSPVPQINMEKAEKVRQLSSSQIEIVVPGEERREGFYKASVNMWKNASCSDDETMQSQKNLEDDEMLLERNGEHLPSSDGERNNSTSSFSHSNGVVFSNSNAGDHLNEENVNGCADKTLSEVTPTSGNEEVIGSICEDNDDAIDCDIACRVELLASRSGSFKQLQPSKKFN